MIRILGLDLPVVGLSPQERDGRRERGVGDLTVDRPYAVVPDRHLEGERSGDGIDAVPRERRPAYVGGRTRSRRGIGRCWRCHRRTGLEVPDGSLRAVEILIS